MKNTERKAWTKDELILVINLYCKTPFGRIHVRNPDIICLAEKLGRTPGSVSYKLANFASIDPSLPRKGASNVSNLDKEVWNEFFENWDEMAYKSEMLSTELLGTEKAITDDDLVIIEGKTKESIIQTRVNQSFFRKMVLSSYNEVCCITGISVAELLVASHIIPWSLDQKNRMNPRNGLCLNALHDRAFDKGIITIDESFNVVVSKSIRNMPSEKVGLITAYDGKEMMMPSRFIPDQEFLDYHRKNVFRG